jgi:hypothetical protein
MEKLRSLGVKEVKADLTLECTGLISKGFDGLKYEVSNLFRILSSVIRVRGLMESTSSAFGGI